MNTTDVGHHHVHGWNDFEFFGIPNLETYKEVDRLRTLADDISNIYIWILFAVGVPGNILTIITILSLQTMCPATFLVALLATLDGSSLIAKLTGHQMIRNLHYIGTIGCKLEFLIIYISSFANWVLLLICTERFFTVCYLSKKAAIFKMNNCYVAVAVLATVLFAIFAGISVPMRESVWRGLRCTTYVEYQWFWINVWYWINATLYMFIPCLCIIPMTVLMVRRLHISGREGISRREKDQENETTESPDVTETDLAANEGGFTLMIILAAMFFVVLCLPACVFYLSHRSSHDALVEAQWVLFEQIQFVLADSTHAINFFLYFLSVARFRDQVVQLILCGPCRTRSFSPEQRIA